MIEANQSLVKKGFSSKVVLPSGEGRKKILIVGEAPGKHEDKEGIPFHPDADAGGMLDRLIRRCGLQREDFRFTNVVWQRPPNNNLEDYYYELEAVEAWKGTLEEEIDRFQPKVIMPMGNIALRALTPFGGHKTGISNIRGYVIKTDRVILPTYHPSYLARGQTQYSGLFIHDLLKAVEGAEKGFVFDQPKLTPHPTPLMMEMFELAYYRYQETHPENRLIWDLETPESGDLDEDEIEKIVTGEEDDQHIGQISWEIIRASCCFDLNYGAISFPWTEPFITIFKRIMASPGPKAGWNDRLFDRGRAKYNGCTLGGEQYDLMDLWGFLQKGLWRALEKVAPCYYTGEPWKHENARNPEYYSAMDSWVEKKLDLGIERDLRAVGKWDVAVRHQIKALHILEQMGRNGLPYNKELAIEFGKELEEKKRVRQERLQEIVPEDLKPVKQKHGLKRTPADFTGKVLRLFEVAPEDVAKGEVIVDQRTDKIVRVKRWATLEPFLPGSSPQCIKLIRHFGHQPGRNYSTRQDSADADTFRKLVTRHKETKKHEVAVEAYRNILDVRQLNTVLTRYVKKWQPGPDGKIHATPGTWGSMFRISWRNPNTAATIQDKREEQIASGFRECIEAPPGYVLLECCSPESKILRSDLVWVDASTIQVGDELIGFSQLGGRDSVYKPAIVEEVKTIFRPRVRVRTTAGECVVAENHHFVARFKSYKRRWIAAKDLMGRLDTGAWLTYFGKPWEVDRSWEAGYLAGFTDGEGSLRATQWQVSQNAGPTLDYVLDLLKAREFQPNRQHVSKISKKSYGYRYGKPYTVQQVSFTRMYDTMRFLGSLQPKRLMEKARQVWEDRQTWGKRSAPVRVLSIEPLGIGPVVAIKTSTGNYISDGYFSHNSDWKGMEAVLVGYFAGDSEYMRWGKLGVHARMTSLVLAEQKRIPEAAQASWSDADLMEHFSELKKRFPFEYDQNKHGVHLSNYGGTPPLMSESFPESFPTIAAAKRWQDFYFSTVASKVRAWQESMIEKAHRECKLTNPFGYTLWFWSVYEWVGSRNLSLKHLWPKWKALQSSTNGLGSSFTTSQAKWMQEIEKGLQKGKVLEYAIRDLCWDRGDDAKSAISFFPRDTGAGMLKEAVLRLEEKYQAAACGVMCTTTHDSMLSLVKEDEVELWAPRIKEEMERPVPELPFEDGSCLWIGVEQMVGKAWSHKKNSPKSMKELILKGKEEIYV